MQPLMVLRPPDHLSPFTAYMLIRPRPPMPASVLLFPLPTDRAQIRTTHQTLPQTLHAMVPVLHPRRNILRLATLRLTVVPLRP